MTGIDRPILYSFRRCPYAMRARMALRRAGQQVELREVVLRDKPAAMLEASPKGTVPVLILPGGEVVDESLDVMLWALAASDPDRWLEPEEGTKEQMLGLIEACEDDFKPHLDRYKYENRYEGVNALAERQLAEAFLVRLEDRLAQAAFLFGARPSLADYAIFPFIRQFANTDRAWFDGAPYPKVQAWLKTLIEGGLFTEVMDKYPRWKPEAEPVTF